MLGKLLTGRVAESILPARQQTAAGTAYDLYQPAKKPLATVMIIYGFSYPGEKDRRVLNFARALSGSGLRVVVPVLPGLKSFVFSPDDLGRLEDLICHLSKQHQTPLRLIAFSFGAGLTLIAAGRPNLAQQIDLLLLFDPYYSLEEAWAELQAMPVASREQKSRWQDHVWNQLVVAYRFRDELPISNADREALLAVLAAYDHDKAAADQYYDAVLAPIGLPPLDALLPSASTLRQLSPAGQLDHVSAGVFIIHDTRYERLSVTHSERILAALPDRPVGPSHRLLATSLVAHVYPRWSTELMDFWPLLLMFAALYD
jgi:pimeloyl-ACP methyl ester carboxylesterase